MLSSQAQSKSARLWQIEQEISSAEKDLVRAQKREYSGHEQSSKLVRKIICLEQEQGKLKHGKS